MASTILELKAAYNILIAQEKTAELAFKDSKYTDAQKETWIPKFNQITECLSMLMADYKKLTGEEMPEHNILNGFGGDNQ